MEELEPCGLSPTSTSQAPYLISLLRAGLERVSEAESWFLLWDQPY